MILKTQNQEIIVTKIVGT